MAVLCQGRGVETRGKQNINRNICFDSFTFPTRNYVAETIVVVILTQCKKEVMWYTCAILIQVTLTVCGDVSVYFYEARGLGLGSVYRYPSVLHENVFVFFRSLFNPCIIPDICRRSLN